MSVTVIDADFAPADVGENVAPIVQDVLGAKLAGQLFDWPNWLAFVPVTAMEAMVRVPVPEFVMVRFCGDDENPTVWLPNAMDDGVSVTAGAIPVPDKVATCGEPGAESTIVKVAGREPTATGVNVTDTLQVAAGASEPPQVVVFE